MGKMEAQNGFHPPELPEESPYADAQCMVYLPTFTKQMMPNVGSIYHIYWVSGNSKHLDLDV